MRWNKKMESGLARLLQRLFESLAPRFDLDLKLTAEDVDPR